jgi:hypothetical protein
MPPKQQKNNWIFWIQWDDMNYSPLIFTTKNKAQLEEQNFKKRKLEYYDSWIEGPFTEKQVHQRIKTVSH